MLSRLFKRNKKKHFVVIVADAPLGKAQFSNLPEGCKYFLASGEITPGVIIPGTVLKAIAEKLDGEPQPAAPEARTSISEKTV